MAEAPSRSQIATSGGLHRKTHRLMGSLGACTRLPLVDDLFEVIPGGSKWKGDYLPQTILGAYLERTPPPALHL